MRTNWDVNGSGRPKRVCAPAARCAPSAVFESFKFGRCTAPDFVLPNVPSLPLRAFSSPASSAVKSRPSVSCPPQAHRQAARFVEGWCSYAAEDMLSAAVVRPSVRVAGASFNAAMDAARSCAPLSPFCIASFPRRGARGPAALTLPRTSTVGCRCTAGDVQRILTSRLVPASRLPHPTLHPCLRRPPIHRCAPRLFADHRRKGPAARRPE